jgi:hypothetical protein
MTFVTNKKFRKTGVLLAVISSVSLGLSFANSKDFTLFCAAWIAPTAIAIHYLLDGSLKIVAFF